MRQLGVRGREVNDTPRSHEHMLTCQIRALPERRCSLILANIVVSRAKPASRKTRASEQHTFPNWEPLKCSHATPSPTVSRVAHSRHWGPRMCIVQGPRI